MHPEAYEAMEEAMDKAMDEDMVISIILSMDSSVLKQVHVCSVKVVHLTSVWKLKVKFFWLENIRSHMYLLQHQRDGIG